MGFVEGETGSSSESCVMCDVDRTEEVSVNVEYGIKEEVNIKVEEAIEIKDEIPEASTLTSIKTEHEVSLGGLWDVEVLRFLGHLLSTKKKM
jgi:phosphoribosyl-dephospho-CoA transferase